jgi:NAD(P)H dehydrogenase (quinone)
MYAIMGATGQTGGAVVDALQRHGVRIRALTRDPAKAVRLEGKGAEIVRADPSDPQSLADAFAGMQGVYVLNVPDPGSGTVRADARRVSAAIAAAVRRANVPHVVALSSSGAQLGEGTGIIRALHELEAALRGTSPSITFLRPTYFMENWGGLVDVAREQGVLPSLRHPIDGKHEIVSAIDVGRTAAECLLEPRDGERIVNLIGPREYSSQDAAAALSTLLGRDVAAVPVPQDAAVPTLMAAGLSADYAREMAGMYQGINAGRVVFEPVGEMRRGAVTLLEALRPLTAPR